MIFKIKNREHKYLFLKKWTKDSKSTSILITADEGKAEEEKNGNTSGSVLGGEEACLPRVLTFILLFQKIPKEKWYESEANKYLFVPYANYLC